MAVDVLAESGESDADGYRPLAVALIVLGMAASGTAFLRWAVNERAMRRHEPLPGLGVGTVLAAGIAVVALGLVLLIVL